MEATQSLKSLYQQWFRSEAGLAQYGVYIRVMYANAYCIARIQYSFVFVSMASIWRLSRLLQTENICQKRKINVPRDLQFCGITKWQKL